MSTSSTLTWDDLQIPATLKREVGKYNAAAKRRWKATPHKYYTCSGGPFDGQPLALETIETATLVVGEARGKYVAAGRIALWEEAK